MNRLGMNRFGPEWTAFCAAHRAAGKPMKKAVALADEDLTALIAIRIPLNSVFSEQHSTSRTKPIFKVVGYKDFKVRIEDVKDKDKGWSESPNVLLNNDLWCFLREGAS